MLLSKKLKNMVNKKISIVIALFVLTAGIFLFGIFGTEGFFSKENDFYKNYSGAKSAINIEEIRKNMESMSVEEIEHLISEIEKEIDRLSSQIN